MTIYLLFACDDGRGYGAFSSCVKAAEFLARDGGDVATMTTALEAGKNSAGCYVISVTLDKGTIFDI